MEHPLLPIVMVESQEYVALNLEQRQRFSKRLSFAQNVLRDASLWLDLPQGEFRDFMDGFELDLTSVMSSNLEDAEGQVSTWFVHSTWTADFIDRDFASLLSERVFRQLDGGFPLFSSSQSAFRQWLKIEVDVTLSVLDDLRNAQALDQAIACLIAGDIFFGRLLVALFKWRLWSPR